jgi:hypothetical protein
MKHLCNQVVKAAAVALFFAPIWLFARGNVPPCVEESLIIANAAGTNVGIERWEAGPGNTLCEIPDKHQSRLNMDVTLLDQAGKDVGCSSSTIQMRVTDAVIQKREDQNYSSPVTVRLSQWGATCEGVPFKRRLKLPGAFVTDAPHSNVYLAVEIPPLGEIRSAATYYVYIQK